MSALPVSPSESAVRAAIERLSRVQPGAYHVVSCYLKLEPRDKTRGKYLIKIKNRIREALAALQRQELERALRAQVAADLERVQAYFGEPTRLPPARGSRCLPAARSSCSRRSRSRTSIARGSRSRPCRWCGNSWHWKRNSAPSSSPRAIAPARGSSR